MSTGTHPFSDWNSSPKGDSITIFGALPTIPVAPTLPVFVSDSLVLQYSTSDVLDCVLYGPNNRSLFSISSDRNAGLTTFRTSDNQVFGTIWFDSQTLVEVCGSTTKLRVRDWLRLSLDRNCRYMTFGTMVCIWKPIQQHVVLLAEDSSILARISRSPSTIALEVTRLAIQRKLLHSCIVAATLFLSGRHID